MTNRERFLKYMKYQSVDCSPLHLVGPWPDTLHRWYNEGLPRGADPNVFLGSPAPLAINNVSGQTGLFPRVTERTIREDEQFRVYTNSYGVTVRDYKDQTTMPEWVEFPVRGRDDLKRVLKEHFDPDRMEERFSVEWQEKISHSDGERLVLIDGGCYYGTLRNLAGVEHASYMFYDAPDLVEELFERMNVICLEGLRRATNRVKIDLIGFGEDIAGKNGPLISPELFRKFLKPRYKKVMDLAHGQGIDLAWYDSDGDVRPLIGDYLEVGINCLAPCEMAASMDPVALRNQFGRDLRMIGGFDKRIVARGPSAIDAEFERLRPVIEEGGFLPAIDHSVSADISFVNYRHFVERLQSVSIFKKANCGIG